MRYCVFSNANSIKNPTQTRAWTSATQIQFSTCARPLLLHKTETQCEFRCYLWIQGDAREIWWWKIIGNKLYFKGRKGGKKRNIDAKEGLRRRDEKGRRKERKYYRKQMISRSQFPEGSESEDAWVWKYRCPVRIKSYMKAKKNGGGETRRRGKGSKNSVNSKGLGGGEVGIKHRNKGRNYK